MLEFLTKMASILALLPLLIGLSAVVRSVWERRGPRRFPLLVLLHDRFSGATRGEILLAVLAGAWVVLGPLAAAAALGWTRLEPNPVPLLVFLLPGVLSGLIKLAWAALEELIFRGAVLPQLARVTNGAIALTLSALLFAWGHLERRGAGAPDAFSLLVFALDGLGFGIAYLATRSLWPPVVWHTVKNICIWLLFDQSTLQLTPGLFQTRSTGPAIWVGAPAQAGILDVIAAFVPIVFLLIVYPRRVRAGLDWVKTQS